jgi:ubiquitin fusion degradation protein 1
MLDWGFGGGGGYGIGGAGVRRVMTFQAEYHCQSTVLAGKDVSDGDKIFLPPSALDKLARMNVEYPMLFEVTSCDSGKRTHCGVLEFSAEEGYCYMPHWMMQNLAVSKSLTHSHSALLL